MPRGQCAGQALFAWRAGGHRAACTWALPPCWSETLIGSGASPYAVAHSTSPHSPSHGLQCRPCFLDAVWPSLSGRPGLFGPMIAVHVAWHCALTSHRLPLPHCFSLSPSQHAPQPPRPLPTLASSAVLGFAGLQPPPQLHPHGAHQQPCPEEVCVLCAAQVPSAHVRCLGSGKYMHTYTHPYIHTPTQMYAYMHTHICTCLHT